jgi:hypothetical protein
LVAGEFAVPFATRWCPSFVPKRRRSPASVRRPSRRAATAGGDVIADVIVALSREPPWTRSISAVRFGWIDLGRPFV